MRGKYLRAIIGGAALFAMTAPAFAVMSMPMGWYLEGNAGSSDVSNISYPGSSSSSGLGGNLDLGYKFMPYVAAEIGYTLYANTVLKDQAGTKAVNVRNYSYDLALKGIVPIGTSGTEAFAKLGVDRVNSSSSIKNQTAANNIGLGNTSNHNASGIYMAIGGQYNFYPEFGVNIQWARAEGSSSTGDMSLISAGLSYIFG